MSIFGNNQRYPASLPDQLRPKPGGLRPEIFQLYDNFQRMPRQTPTPGGIAANAAIAPGGALPGAQEPAAQQAAQQKPLGIEAMNSLVSKLDSAITSLLASAGPRAPFRRSRRS